MRYSFSQIRNFALRARGFCSISSAVGRIGLPDFLLMSGFLPHTQTGNSFGQVQGCIRLAILSLTIRSSSEWKVITQSLPPGASTSQNASTAFSSCPSSSLTSMRIAWKVRFAGCGPSRRADAGIAALMMSTSSVVVSMGLSLRALTMKSAMRAAQRSSP